MSEKRSLSQEIISSIQSIKKGEGKKRIIEHSIKVNELREHLSLSQSSFASLMGVSTRTLQEWEQGRRKPSGPAISLLRLAQKHPEAFIDLI